MASWQSTLVYLALAVPAIPFVVAGIRFARLSTPQKWLFLLLGFTLLSNSASQLLPEFDLPNLWIFHIYVLVDFALLTLVFRELVPKRLAIGAISLFTTMGIFLLFWNGGWKGLPSVTMGVEAFWMVFLTFWYFWKVYREMKILRLERQFLFWFGTGNLLYFSGNLLLFIFSNYIIGQSPTLAIQIWMANVVLTFLRILFYTIALAWKDPA